jgi:hypothetical protein
LVLERDVKRFLVIAGIGLLVSWAALVIMQRAARDPETDNITDVDDLPSFFSSDPSLLTSGPYRVQEQFAPTDSRSGAETPYFVQLADGRYACGYTDLKGQTKPLFTRHKIDHQVFWDDEAWSKWRAVRSHATH